MTTAGRPTGAARPATVLQGGRAKAYRPIPAADRARAFEAALDAYEQGDFFEAHELLEPAWMGTDNIAERELYQGLIKLAAGYVHAVRGNPAGLAKNLRGARDRLAAAQEASAVTGDVDLVGLLAAIDDRLARLAANPGDGTIDPPTARRTSR
jgi:predicted metal-dependent hydrolase